MRNENGKLVWSDEIEEISRRAAAFYARRFGIKREDREDYVQDVVVKVYQRIQAEKLCYIEAIWLIARRRAIDIFVKNQVQTMQIFEDVAPVEERHLVFELKESVQSEIPELLVIAEARAAGYDWGMIAQALGCHVGSLRMKWTRLSRKARKKFGHEFGLID